MGEWLNSVKTLSQSLAIDYGYAEFLRIKQVFLRWFPGLVDTSTCISISNQTTFLQNISFVPRWDVSKAEFLW